MTERAGLAVLDDTAQSLFADVDNDGAQDLVLATGTRPLLFANDGHGQFAPVADAFRFERPLQGVLTSIAVADYDRDGFLDLYLCVYSYFFGGRTSPPSHRPARAATSSKVTRPFVAPRFNGPRACRRCSPTSAVQHRVLDPQCRGGSISAANLTGTDGNPNARVVLTCDPGSGWSGDPYRQINTACFAPPQPGSDGAESARFFLHAPPINNIDLSLSKKIRIRGDIGAEIRLDIFNALNHTQFTGVNNTVNFASLSDPTITNLPYDSSGNLVRPNGFGTINGVAPPRQLQLVMRFTF